MVLIACFLISYLILVPNFMMSVDKFGRFSSSSNAPSVQGPRGPKGDGFNLTNNGDYDIKFKRICNVGTPREKSDAVNFDTLNVSITSCLSMNDKTEYDAKGHKVCNLGEPINDNDAVSKLYFTLNSPVKLVDSYSFHQFRIQDLNYPIADGDAVNYKTFNDKALVIDRGMFNAKNLNISNVSDPKLSQDSVNLRYLQSNTLVLKENKEYDANGYNIKNLGFPKRKADAISYSFITDVLAEMSFAIYNNFKKKSKPRLTKEEWKRKVTKSLYTCDWNDLFGVSENALVQPRNNSPESSDINTEKDGQ